MKEYHRRDSLIVTDLDDSLSREEVRMITRENCQFSFRINSRVLFWTKRIVFTFKPNKMNCLRPTVLTLSLSPHRHPFSISPPRSIRYNRPGRHGREWYQGQKHVFFRNQFPGRLYICPG